MIDQAPILGQCTIEIQRNPKRAARTTELSVRGMSVTIAVPKDHKQRSQFAPVRLNFLLVEELTPLLMTRRFAGCC